MESIYIKETGLSPKVDLDKDNNRFIIVGKSIVENAQDFYLPILEWFIEYFNDPNEKTELLFYLEYINSSSYLQIAKITEIFSQNMKNKNLMIKWLYDKEDDTMQEIGEDLQFTYLVKFNFIEINDANIDNFNLSLY